jgi:hypothetical protein
MRYCDQVTHAPFIINDTQDAMVAVCSQCKQMEVFRKDPDGRMNHKKYLTFFKRDTLQSYDNLYFKYNSSKMNVL